MHQVLDSTLKHLVPIRKVSSFDLESVYRVNGGKGMYQQWWHFSRSAKIASSFLNLIRFIYASITIYQKKRRTFLKVTTKVQSIISTNFFPLFLRVQTPQNNFQVLIHGQHRRAAAAFKGPFCLHEGWGVGRFAKWTFLGQH